jgi:ankyrin repeat protein
MQQPASFNATATQELRDAMRRWDIIRIDSDTIIERMRKLIFVLDADPNVRSNEYGETFVHCMISNSPVHSSENTRNGLRKLLILFLECPYFDVNATNAAGFSLLHTLISKKYDQLDLLEILLSDPRTNVNIRRATTRYNQYNEMETPLHLVCYSAVLAAGKAKALLERGANPNAVTAREGKTPLHILLSNIQFFVRMCSTSDMFQVAEVLLEYGANPNKYDNTFDAPLHIVAAPATPLYSGKLAADFTALLLRNGGDPLKTNVHDMDAFDLVQQKMSRSDAAAINNNMQVEVLESWMDHRRTHYRMVSNRISSSTKNGGSPFGSLPLDVRRRITYPVFDEPHDNSKNLRFTFDN